MRVLVPRFDDPGAGGDVMRFFPPPEGAFERVIRWPAKGEPGKFLVRCSCEKWAVVGTAEEIEIASSRHDDSPFRNHVTMIYGRLIELRTG